MSQGQAASSTSHSANRARTNGRVDVSSAASSAIRACEERANAAKNKIDTLKAAKLKSIEETETKKGKEVQLVLTPAKVTHTCKKFMLEPGQQPKARLERQG